MKELLDKHGYSFQQAVERHVRELSQNPAFDWNVTTAELPVAGNGWTTRIDLLLNNRHTSLWLVAECKRTDPAFAWYFALGGPSLPRQAVVLEFTGERDRTYADPVHHIVSGAGPYHIGVVGKSNQKGDGTGAGRDQIEEAATQAIRGASGLINFFAAAHREEGNLSGVKKRVMPAIVTTARLYTTDADLGVASLQDGHLPEEVAVEQTPWLLYQYQRSPHLDHDVESRALLRDPKNANQALYSRTVAVITAEHLADFLWKVA